MQRSLKKYFPLFVLPTLLAFAISFLVPFVMGFILSFCEFTTVTDATWVGLANYQEAFKERSGFVGSFGFTALIVIVSIVTVNIFSFAIAWVLTQKLRGTNFFRTVFFMPNLIGGIVLGYTWQVMINAVLVHYQTTIIADWKYGYIGMIMLINWQQVGYMMIIYIAGLQNVPPELIEAAEIDGADKFTTYRQIIFPMLKPMHATTLIINALWFWNDFMLPLLVLNKDSKMWTLPLFQYNYQGQYFNDYGPSFASYIVGIITITIVYLIFQKNIISGMSNGAVK